MDNNKIDYKISPNPSLIKRGKYLPLWKRGIKGDFRIDNSLYLKDIICGFN
jgi:hypothetical protein